ncbi:MAG: hypothetical protein AAFS03_12005, partial [Pseudomonadota bacterium]
EVRHFQNFADFAVVFAQALLAEEGRRHVERISVSIIALAGWGAGPKPDLDRSVSIPEAASQYASPETDNDPVKAGHPCFERVISSDDAKSCGLVESRTDT